jgi:NTE family protein
MTADNGTTKKVGLALGGGAAKGFAHIGVLEVLEREGIPIDMISGTSIGAVVGAFYALTRNIRIMKDLALEVGRKRAYYFSDVSVPRTGLIRLARLERLLKTVIDGVNFKDLQIPFSCVAVDMDSGEEVVLDRGPVWDAIRASSAIPVVVSLARIRGRNLLDGGLLNPVPVNVVKRMGADFVVAVNVVSEKERLPSDKPNIFTIMMKTIHIIGRQSLTTSLQKADVVIEPDLDSVGFADFNLAQESFASGQAAAERALPEILRGLRSG